VSQREKTENQAEQNKSHAVAGIEAHPTPPHSCFSRNDGRDLAHADLQRGVAGREIWPPERIDEVDDSERKDNARTKNHENFCSQDASLFCVKVHRADYSLALACLTRRSLRSGTAIRPRPVDPPSPARCRQPEQFLWWRSSCTVIQSSGSLVETASVP
jgi:hypothetical protein